jgi:hypothetical protein
VIKIRAGERPQRAGTCPGPTAGDYPGTDLEEEISG